MKTISLNIGKYLWKPTPIAFKDISPEIIKVDLCKFASWKIEETFTIIKLSSDSQVKIIRK
jgi:hypothetical protein